MNPLGRYEDKVVLQTLVEPAIFQREPHIGFVCPYGRSDLVHVFDARPCLAAGGMRPNFRKFAFIGTYPMLGFQLDLIEDLGEDVGRIHE